MSGQLPFSYGTSVRWYWILKENRKNNLPPSTPPNTTIKAEQSIKISFPCLCRGGKGVSAKRSIYSVVKDDRLYHITVEVFSGLSSVDMIAEYNGIKNRNLIEVGQKLWVPLPCSCDSVGSEGVVHFGYAVPVGGVCRVCSQFTRIEKETRGWGK